MNTRVDPLFDYLIWRKILQALAVNMVSALVVISFLFLSGVVKESPAKVIKTFSEEKEIKTSDEKTVKRPPHPFFMPINKLLEPYDKKPIESKFVRIFVINVFDEEIVYRGPIRIAATLMLFLGFKNKRLLVLFLWLVGLWLNFYWAHELHNEYNKFLWIPVFTAGIPWLWLTIETKRLWPSVVCHALANFNIYFLLKIPRLFY